MRLIDGFISRRQLIDALIVWRDHDEYSKKRWFYEKWVRTVGINVLIEVLKHFPTVDAVKVVHGQWEDMDNDPKCSICGRYAVSDKHAVKHYDYCPHCGAKMD